MEIEERRGRPTVVDAVVIKEGKILLVKRNKPPFKNRWALPGGFIEMNETAEEAVIRETKEETGISVKPIDLVGVYSSPERDPRKTISIVFLCEYINGKIRGGSDASHAKFYSINKPPKLAFDHAKIIKDVKNWL